VVVGDASSCSVQKHSKEQVGIANIANMTGMQEPFTGHISWHLADLQVAAAAAMPTFTWQAYGTMPQCALPKGLKQNTVVYSCAKCASLLSMASQQARDYANPSTICLPTLTQQLLEFLV
jgi:hypothetical protein